MLTVFIMSGGKKKNEQRLVKSFGDIETEFIRVQRVDQINSSIKQGDWFMILFDDEFLDSSLRDVIPTFMEHDKNSTYVVMKRTQGDEGREVTESPRLFKSTLMLEKDSFIPINVGSLKSERILNGWIFDDNSVF